MPIDQDNINNIQPLKFNNLPMNTRQQYNFHLINYFIIGFSFSIK